MVDVRGPTYQLPLHRKPLPSQPGGDARLRPLTQIVPDMSYHQMQVPAAAGQQGTPSLHRHSRTSSSSVFPVSSSGYSLTHTTSNASQNSTATNSAQYFNPTTRRTLSSATTSTSTTSTSGNPNSLRNSTVSVSLRRSTSSRSGNTSPSSYVSLMRKQKATVWCDRSQYEDPRLMAQQKAAKMRAAMEVVGASANAQHRISSSGSSSMMGSSMVSRAKIRHHGLPKAVGYSAANMVGAGVPMRLSASEVDNDNGSDDDTDSQRTGTGLGYYHRRTGSGRSSLGSGRRPTNLRYSQASRGSSTGNTPPNDHSPIGSMPGDLETPVPAGHPRASAGSADYFSGGGGGGSSGESRENSFGRVDQLTGPPAASSSSKGGMQRRSSEYTADELRRRGSVDDRTMTMTGVRLFVANPDLSD